MRCRQGAGRRRPRGPLGPRLDVVGAADLHGHGRLAEGELTLPRLQGSLVPSFQRHRVPIRRQLCKRATQVHESPAPPGRRIDGHRGDVLVREDLVDQGTQPAAGTNLHEGAHAVLEHRLHALHEVHRRGQLAGQELAGIRRAVGVRRTRGVGVDRHGAAGQLDARQALGEGRSRLCNQAAVEGGRHREPPCLDLFTGQQILRPLDLVCHPGEHRLSRRVVVGNDQVEVMRLEEPLDPGELGNDREHRAPVAVAHGHELAPAP